MQERRHGGRYATLAITFGAVAIRQSFKNCLIEALELNDTSQWLTCGDGVCSVRLL